MTIPSPYYFVPLSEHIFFPGWSAQASMDVPFNNGISGSLQVRVTAETPIYIRSGTGKRDSKENDDFFRVLPGCSYAINGSSMKGMLRSIIEIASFGRFSTDAQKARDLLDKINPNHLNSSPTDDSPAFDLAQTMFGASADSTGLAGRIQVEPLLAERDPQTMAKVTTTLNSPKPTFFPNYLKQSTKNMGMVIGSHTTYNNNDARPGGFKRYPARQFVWEEQENEIGGIPNPPNDDMEVTFNPLPIGTSFTGFIHLHNVLPCELGALQWALTWGGNETLRHVMGMAKPFGFGTVKVEILATNLYQGPDENEVDLGDEYIQEFTQIMKNWCRDKSDSGWQDSPQISELLAMADPANHGRIQERLTRYPGLRDFARFKRQRKALLSYSRQVKVGQE